VCTLKIIFVLMLTSGVLGGLVNSFLSDPSDERPLHWFKHIVVGVAASFMVPLFLNMISGDLIDKIRGSSTGQPDYSKLFVLAGFCLVAAVSSRTFIRTISDKVLQQVKEANRKADEAKVDAATAMAVVEPMVEAEADADVTDTLDALKASPAPVTSENESKVLKAMTRSSYSLRSITGIARDCGLSRSLVNITLSSLISKGLVQQGIGTSGQPRWFAAPEGRKLVEDDQSLSQGYVAR